MLYLVFKRFPYLLAIVFTSMAYSAPKNAYLPDAKRIDSWQCVHGFRKAGEECEKIAVPSNAFLKDYHNNVGDPWRCRRGFIKSAESCVEINVPPNAHFDSSTSGKGWECVFGFEQRDENCSAVQIPDNAYLDRSSWRNDWKCEIGYLKSEDECVQHELPENAVYVSDYKGFRWQCRRGYLRVNDNQCAFIAVPENGYLSDAYEDRATGWGCERGFIPEKDNCTKMEIPANGYLAGYRGRVSINCDRGYKLQNSACFKVVIPENGFLRESGDNWGCKKPYVRRQNDCLHPSAI